MPIEEIIDRELPFFSRIAEYIYIAPRGERVIELGVEDVTYSQLFVGFMHETEDGGVLTMRQPIPGHTLHHPNLQINVLEPLDALEIGEVIALNPTDLTPFGLHDPALEFIYYDADGSAHLLFGDTFQQDGVAFIYVKFADRPHVFSAAAQPISVLHDIPLFSIVDRFIALTDIQEVDSIYVSFQDSAENFDLQINHHDDGIEPTKNNLPVDESEFRIVYRNLISLSADVEITPTEPTTEPQIIITFDKRDTENTILRLYPHDANFYYVSVNGETPWFLTNRRDVELFISSSIALLT